MSYDVPFGGRMAGQSRPLIPSEEHHGGKGTEEKGDMQGRGGFLYLRRDYGDVPVKLLLGKSAQ